MKFDFRMTVATVWFLTACTEVTAERTVVLPLTGPVDGKGSFSCDFELPPWMDPATIGPIIERDRMYMAEQDGFIRKHIPFLPDLPGGYIQTGGRYFFEKYNDAVRYQSWVEDDFILDGVHFLDRDYFLNPACRTWRVVGAHDFQAFSTSHHVIRTERFLEPLTAPRRTLRQMWPEIRDEAEVRGLSSVSIAHNPGEGLVEILHVSSNQIAPLATMALMATLGGPLLAENYVQVFDRTQFVVTGWFPFAPGDSGSPAIWPNSPPLPAPSCGDAVCEPSRGEDAGTCASDCPANCGDATCQPGEGEDTQTCPSDCRI